MYLSSVSEAYVGYSYGFMSWHRARHVGQHESTRTLGGSCDVVRDTIGSQGLVVPEESVHGLCSGRAFVVLEGYDISGILRLDGNNDLSLKSIITVATFWFCSFNLK